MFSNLRSYNHTNHLCDILFVSYFSLVTMSVSPLSGHRIADSFVGRVYYTYPCAMQQFKISIIKQISREPFLKLDTKSESRHPLQTRS